MTIVMGLDQHRAQITAEWVDTDTGEISRARVAPAHREAVRRFLSRFRGQAVEVALEATTGWRFVVEELRRLGEMYPRSDPTQLPDHAYYQQTAARLGHKRACLAREAPTPRIARLPSQSCTSSVPR